MRIARESDLDPQIVKALLKDPNTKSRPIKTHKVEWFKIIGDEVADRARLARHLHPHRAGASAKRP
jgi:hypothetical protein